MFAHVVAFELRYQLRAPLFAISCALFFLLSFGSVALDEVHIGGIGNVHANSPYAIALTMAIMGVFATFVATAFVANVIVRDDETGFAPIVLSTRITKRDYLFGRFVGAWLAAAALLSSVPLAILVGSCMPWVDPEKLGPIVAGHYLFAYFAIGLPTSFVIASVFFALASATRSMTWTYVGLVTCLMLFFTSRALLQDPRYETLSVLSDPFGVSALSRTTRYWTATDRNTRLPYFDALAWQSRGLWLGVAMGLLGLAYSRFRFDWSPAYAGAKRERSEGDVSAPQLRAPHVAWTSPRPRPNAWGQLNALVGFDMRYVFRSPAFFVLLAVAMLNALGGLQGSVADHGAKYLPVTRAVVSALLGSFNIFPIIAAIYYAGELVWRDHDRRMHEIVASTCAPGWTFVVPKVLAIGLVLSAMFAAAVLLGCSFQLAHGYTELELGHYITWLVVPGAISALQLAILSVFVQTLAPNKLIGWAVMLLYIVAQTTLGKLGFEHNLYTYGGTPRVRLSDMNGLGHDWVGWVWFEAYWLAFGVVLLVLTHALWRRGVDPGLTHRLKQLRHNLQGRASLVLGCAVVSWLGLGAWAYYNTNVLNHYRTQLDLDQARADYERALLQYDAVAQPRIVDITLNAELYPRDRRLVTSGQYRFENRTDHALRELHVAWNPVDLELNELDVEGGRLTRELTQHHYRIYELTPPLNPGEQRRLSFRTTLEDKGFVNERSQVRLVENGSFVDASDIAPWFGWNGQLALRDRSKRRKYGLPQELRMPKLEDATANAKHYVRHDADFVTADITLTTDADQTPVAPGQTLSDSTRGGRRTLHTRSDAPILPMFSMQSARYAVQRDTWQPAHAEAVALSVYFHPPHNRNVPRMLEVMKRSLDAFSSAFSPYQFRQARILEFPAYASFAQSFANTIPYSEALGFVQEPPRSDLPHNADIDFVAYVTAHEIAHQWWAHQLIGADKQGGTFLSETLAQYSAMLVMEQLYSPAMARKFLKHELDQYLRARGSEAVEELPLARVENQPYIHYQKGTLVMYWLKESVGVEVVNRALRRLLDAHAFKPGPYPSSADFIGLLREEAGPRWDTLITDLFERITLYDLSARDAKAERLPDGRYRVTFSVDAQKLYADPQGGETTTAFTDEVEVGVFNMHPGKPLFTQANVLQLERQKLVAGRQQIVFDVSLEPSYVGIDPYNKLIDRNSDDNLTEVRIEP